jgi:cytochrome c-type biogenesis protein CcmF
LTYLTTLYLPGALAMWCALLFSLASLWGYSMVLRGDAAALGFARRAYNCFTLSVVLGGVVLAFALLTRDFRIEYVWQYTGLELPVHYQFAAFWAGQKGSFLIWLLWGALLGTLVYRSAGRRQEPTVMTVYLLSVIGLLFILVRENPFVMLAETPADGKGLNPLLQDDWMVIHPPIMFVGFAASAVPFAFAMAALWRRDYGGGWARRAFPWALGGFLVLGLAILLGGYWAYKTLGWGGYWGWDPVENASLIPFIFGTVLIHGLYLERTRGRFRRANFILATLVYLAVLYGTFLTRSGVLADFSVHSFVDLGISGWLVGLMAFFGLGSLWLLATRLPQVPTRPNEDPFVSRGTALILSTITLLASALVITFGTSAPLLTAFLENPGQVGPEFYNRVNLPIALLLALLLALVPFLTWRGGPLREILRKMAPSLLAALVVAAVAAAVAVRNPFFLLYFFLAALAMGTNLHKAVLKARTQGVRAAGGYLAHVGVGIILIGFLASSGFDRSTKVTLPLDQPQEVDGRTLTFVGFLEKTSPRDKDALVVEVEEPGGRKFYSYPKLFRNDRTGQTMANPHVRSSPLADFYVSPLEYQPGEPAGGGELLALAQGESAEVGGSRLRFAGFDLGLDGGNALARMMEGSGTVTLGVEVELTGPDGETRQLLPLYRIDQARGIVQTPPLAVPGGGTIQVSGINATEGQVRLTVQGLPGMGGQAGQPPALAVDVTEKPLIQLVWLGLWVILGGGSLAVINRLRQAMTPAPAAEPAGES